LKKTAQVRRRSLYRGRYLHLVREGHWEYVERVQCTAVAVIIAQTAEGKILFTDQYRVPIHARAIEFPAGLVDDEEGKKGESIVDAARRELIEETGYRAKRMDLIFQGPVSSGLTSECITFLWARDLEKIAKGGGVGFESIRVYEIEFDRVDRWLADRVKKGFSVDPKIYAGLYFLSSRKRRQPSRAARKTARTFSG